MLFIKLIEILIGLGSPSRWPRIWRRLFVFCFPVTVPVMVAGWCLAILIVIAAAVIGIIVCIAIEMVDYLIGLWHR